MAVEAALVADLYDIIGRFQSSIVGTNMNMCQDEKDAFGNQSVCIASAEKRARMLGSKKLLVLAEMLKRVNAQLDEANESVVIPDLEKTNYDPYDEGSVNLWQEAREYLCRRWNEIGTFYSARLEQFAEVLIGGPPSELFVFEQMRNYDIFPYIRKQTKPVTYGPGGRGFESLRVRHL